MSLGSIVDWRTSILKIMLLQDKLVETSSKAIIPSAPPLDVATYSLMMQHMDQNEHLPCEG